MSHHSNRVDALDSQLIPGKMDEDKLIIAVQRRPMIYDKEDKNYHNRDIISATWEGISKEVFFLYSKCGININCWTTAAGSTVNAA